ncbi:MAG: four helix bundle protein [Oscillospiraceae bacterium]|nr:four helix bundle protein [Oscillospiraceae bacterium]
MIDEAMTVQQKSRQFAVRIVRLYQYLCNEKKEFVLSKQLLRCGTSIGANIAESECAFSRKEFLAKMYIAFKETNETLYWLDLLRDTDFLTEGEYLSIYADCKELHKMLASITKSTREK